MNVLSHERLLESLYEGVYFVDSDKRITVWNQGAERITGFNRSEVLGACCADNILRHIDDEGRELCTDGCPLAATLADGQVHEARVHLHHKEGHRVPVTARMSPVLDDEGNIIGGIEVFSDSSGAQQMLQELETLKKEVYQDALTGVSNRRYAERMLQARLYELNALSVPFGLVFLDIDHFKQFNDRYSHKTGDDVLIMVSRTIANMLRRLDTVSRWGGEEFVVLLQNVNAAFLHAAAERIRIFIERSFIMCGDEKLTVTASLGATMALPDDTPESLILRADQLMYASKTGGRNRVTVG